MKTSSAKAKGRRQQQFVRDLMLELAPHLQPDDVRSTSMGASGEDLLLSPAAREVYPIASEVKNVERINIWAAIRQAEEHAGEGKAPVVHFSRNHAGCYSCIPTFELLSLYSQLHNYRKGDTT